MKKTTVVALVLTILGLLLIAAAAVLEARNYPWRHRLGIAPQDAAALPEPSPVVPDEEEAVVVYMEVVETPAVWEENAAQDAPPDVLPGAEEEESAEPSESAQPVESAPPKVQYTVIGTLKIPALNVSQNILEGTGKELKYGVGRLTLSAYPGQRGNCVIAGHRPYPFRYLNMLAAGDIISIRFNGVTYTYSVYDSFEVLPTETWVLSRVEGHPYTLTLITCTPYMVSSHRLIIRAELTEIDGVPFEDPAAAVDEAGARGDENADADSEGADGEAAAGGAGEAAGGEAVTGEGRTGGAGGEAALPAGEAGGEGSPGADTGASAGGGATEETPASAPGGAAASGAPEPQAG